MKLNSDTDYEFAKKPLKGILKTKKATDPMSKDEIGYMLFFSEINRGFQL